MSSAPTNATAVHEAAHAVVQTVLGYLVEETTISSAVPGKLGHTSGDVLTPEPKEKLRPPVARNFDDGETAVVCDETVILLVGDIAEARYADTDYDAPTVDSRRSSDEAEASGRVVTLRPGDMDAQDQLMRALVARAVHLVDQHWEAIQAVAAALAERDPLTGDEVREIVGAS